MGAQTLDVKDGTGTTRTISTFEALVAGAGGLANPDAGTLANLFRKMLVNQADVIDESEVGVTGTTPVNVLGAPAGGFVHNITSCFLTNTSTTDTIVTISDGGVFEASIAVKAKSTGGFAGLQDPLVFTGALSVTLADAAAVVNVTFVGNVAAAS